MNNGGNGRAHNLDLSFAAYEHCELCPRMCGARRASGERGACGMDAQLRIARSALHFWEEPPISGETGSGTIFFSGCALRCIYCQNQEISQGGFGAEVSVERLAQMMCELEAQGALNINLVTPGHFAPHIVTALTLARERGMALPVVWNTSGYERPELVEALDSAVDIWLIDFKYASPELAQRFSAAANYPTVAHAALAAMWQQVQAAGGRRLAADGRMLAGVVVRHLVLPAHTNDSCRVLSIVAETCGTTCDLSVMSQYTPNAHCRRRADELSRRVSAAEYERVLDYADELGFEQLWWQEGESAEESFIPAFDLTGVEAPKFSDL